MTPLQLFRNLVAAAHVDGAVPPEEIGVLVRYQERLGLSDADRQQTFAEVEAAPASFRLPTKEPERGLLFEGMCELAVADGEVSSAERRLLASVAKRFGYPEPDLSVDLERAGSAPIEDAPARNRESARPQRGSGVDRFWPLTGLFVCAVLVWTSGLLASYEGPVTQLKRSGAENDLAVLEIAGQSRRVPERVFEAAQVGSTVQKKLLRPWWTVDGAVLWGPSALLLLFLIPAGVCLPVAFRAEPPDRLPLGLAVGLTSAGLAACGWLLLQTKHDLAVHALVAAVLLPLLWGAAEWSLEPRRKRLRQA